MQTNLFPGTFLKNKSYRIKQLLGQGGFGAVYLVDDLILGSQCAIKESFDNSPGSQAQFEIEARILSNINHPHLPRVTDNFIDSDSGLQYLVMEYVEGQDLGKLIEKFGPLPEDKVRDYIDQVLDAVAYLHALKPRPVIHRDIKPDNIRLLPDDKTIKLVDFGIAKIGNIADKTRGAARGVTPGFSPPEQYGSGTDTYSDVYSIGTTTYFLLTNIVPPQSIDLAYSGAKIIPASQLNNQISKELEQIILTAMQIEPSLRFRNAGDMRSALHGKRPTIITSTCPHCGNIVKTSSKFCTKCGRELFRVSAFMFKKSGFQANTIKELIRGCDTYWKEALEYFQRGEIELWLNRLGPDGQRLSAQSQSLRAKYSDSSAALEAFLEIASPTRSLPILTIKPTELDLGSKRCGEIITTELNIANSGRGYLHGSIQAQPGWIQISPINFGCIAGETCQINIIINSTDLSGTELGVHYNGTITLLSNRGHQVIPVNLKIIEEPNACLEPANIDLGNVAWGTEQNKKIKLSNSGGGTLSCSLFTDVSWIKIPIADQPISLGKGQSLLTEVIIDTTLCDKKDKYIGHIQTRAKGIRSTSTSVTINVGLPYLLDVRQPNSNVSGIIELLEICDRQWDQALQWFNLGSIEKFFYFIGEHTLEKVSADAQKIPDPNSGLEQLLRAAGAPPPCEYKTNIKEVLSQLGFGLIPKRSKPTKITLLIENLSKRGYLHGSIHSLEAWINIPESNFGCLPGRTACIELFINYSAKNVGAFSLGKELFEIEFI